MSKFPPHATKSKYLNFFSLFLIVFVMLTAIGFLQIFNLDKKVEAALNTTTLYGNAWSSNVGWISFNNCPSEGSPSCGPIEYSVEVDSNGDANGAMWSDNIGWIKVGGLSGFPAGGGSASNMKMTLNSGAKKGKVEGWIRACAGTINGDCSSMTSRDDGWDGWISLSGTNHTSPDFTGNGGVTYDEDADPQPKVIGNAWGSEVVGWINFYDVSFGPPAEENFDYEISNASPNYEKQIEQGDTGNVGLNLSYTAGPGEIVTLSVTSLAGDFTISPIIVNNPCNLSSVNPQCISSVNITVNLSAPVGQYSFTVDAESNPTSVNKSTLVRFEVVPAGSLTDPEVSCGIEGGQTIFFPGDPVMWTATVLNPSDFDDYDWRGENVPVSCNDNTTCEVTYTTSGRKAPEVSINAGGTFVKCDPLIYVIPEFFQIFEF